MTNVITYPRDSIVDIKQVAAALQVSVGTVEKMDLPIVRIGARKRFVWSMVLDELERRASSEATPPLRMQGRKRGAA